MSIINAISLSLVFNVLSSTKADTFLNISVEIFAFLHSLSAESIASITLFLPLLFANISRLVSSCSSARLIITALVLSSITFFCSKLIVSKTYLQKREKPNTFTFWHFFAPSLSRNTFSVSKEL